MKAYKMLIKCKTWNGKEEFFPLQPTNGSPYIFKTKQHLLDTYRSLYYMQTFLPFNEVAKIEEIEVNNDFNDFTVYGSY